MVDDDFLKMVKQLQTKIEYEEEETYSKIVISEYRNPTNFGILDHPDTVGLFKGPCGDSMKITLKIEKGIISDARFWTNGCGATIACGNKLTKMIKRKKLKDANNISQKDLTIALDGLPRNHSHCAKLTIIVLRKAIKNYYKRNKEVEKKFLSVHC